MIDQLFEMKGKKLGPFKESATSKITGMWEDNFWVEDQCTCPPVKGPTMADNPDFVMCQFCKDEHKKYFPAFPGQPGWKLNEGAVKRNTWGIIPGKVKPQSKN